MTLATRSNPLGKGRVLDANDTGKRHSFELDAIKLSKHLFALLSLRAYTPQTPLLIPQKSVKNQYFTLDPDMDEMF